MPLPIAGLMSPKTKDEIASSEQSLLSLSREIGLKNENGFMTLSFLALPVIPELRICPDGLFDVAEFELTDLEA